MVTVVLVLVGLAAVGYVLVSRVRGQRLNARRLLMLPAVLTAIGVVQVAGVAHRGFGTADLALLATGVVVSAALGMARGATVAVSTQDGRPWLRYRRATLVLWGVTFAVRVALTGLAVGLGAALAASGPALLLTVGVTLLGEGAVVAHRAFSPDDSRWHARSQRHPAASR